LISPCDNRSKKRMDGKPKFRFCVDLRALNAVTKFDPYTLHRLEDSTTSLSGSKYFSVLYCYSGFWQINISEQHKELTGFTVPSGHYEFNRLPFGLNNSPANFQRLTHSVLKDLVGTDCCIYLDDLILFSKTAEEHAVKLERVLERLERAHLQLHHGKYVIAQTKVKYLGYVLSEKGVSASSDKIDAVRNYPTPETRKTLGHSWDSRHFTEDSCKNLQRQRNRLRNSPGRDRNSTGALASKRRLMS